MQCLAARSMSRRVSSRVSGETRTRAPATVVRRPLKPLHSRAINGSALSDTSPSSSGRFEAELRRMPEAELADTLWGYLFTHGVDPAVFASVAKVVSDDPDRFQPTTLVSLLSAFSTARYGDRQMVATAAARLAAPGAMRELNTGTLAHAAWATALLCSQGAVEFDKEEAVQNMMIAVQREARSKVSDFDPEDLARLFVSFAEVGAPLPSTLVEATNNRLMDVLIPTSQLTAASLAQILWAYARLGVYDQELFDAAAGALTRKTSELDWEGLAQTSWAYSQVRGLDPSSRARKDLPLLKALAAQVAERIQSALLSPHGASLTPSVSIKTAGGLPLQAQATLDPAGERPSAPAVVQPHLMTVLLSYAELSHHDDRLFASAARWLSPQLMSATLRTEDMVVTAYVFTRVKHSAPQLILALAKVVPQVLDRLDGDDLVYLASLGPATDVYSDTLMKTLLEHALRVSAAQPGCLSASVLMDLARCCAAVAGHDETYYTRVQEELMTRAYDMTS